MCLCKQKASPGVRVGVIDNPSGKPSKDNTVLYRAIWASLLTQKNKAAAEFVQKLLKEESIQLLQKGTKMKDLLMQVKEGLRNAILVFVRSEIIRFQINNLINLIYLIFQANRSQLDSVFFSITSQFADCVVI